MKYGCRAHDYGCFTAKGLADVLTANGYNAAQLAMPKAIRGIPNFTDITPKTPSPQSAAPCTTRKPSVRNTSAAKAPAAI